MSVFIGILPKTEDALLALQKEWKVIKHGVVKVGDSFIMDYWPPLDKEIHVLAINRPIALTGKVLEKPDESATGFTFFETGTMVDIDFNMIYAWKLAPTSTEIKND